MKSLKHFIRSFDVFAKPITLTFYQKVKFSTSNGGFLTICMVILLFIIAVNKMNDVVNHKFVSSFVTESIKSTPPPVKINNFFAFTFEPVIMNSLNGKRYFDFGVDFPIYTRLPNGTQIKDRSIKFILSHCNSTHFPMFTTKQITNYAMTDWVCPNIPENSEIAGNYDSSIYKFINLKISKCGTYRPLSLNESCASDDEIRNLLLQNGGKIYLNLKFVNNLLNVDDLENPFTPYIDQITFLIDAPNSFVQKEMSLTSVNVQTDDSIIKLDSNFYPTSQLRSSIYEGKIFEFGLSQPQNESGRINYASIYFESNSKDKTFQRKYSTIQDVLQLVGSFWTVLFAVFGFLNRIFAKNSFLIKLANSLYLFPSKNPSESNNTFKTNQELMKVDFNKNGPDEINNMKAIKQIAKLQNTRKKQKFRHSYYKNLKNFFQGKNPDYKIEEIDNVMNMALDINQILKKNNELDKLKHILLTKEQQMLFNFSTKPTFHSTKDRAASLSFLKYHEKLKKNKKKTKFNLDTPSIYENLFKSYLMIKEDGNHVSKKIIQILDSEILNLFEKYNEERNLNIPTTLNSTPFVSDVQLKFKIIRTDEEIPMEKIDKEKINSIN